MALPQDGQNANGLTKVTEIPKGKERERFKFCVNRKN